MKRIILTVLSLAAIVLGSIVNVFAATDTIQLGNATKTNAYIAGVDFYYKVTNKGQYLYCLNMHKNTATNVKANIVKNSPYITGGLIHILKNGYPNKSITGDKEKDYYITQTAVWWYLDKTTGSTNLGEQFKENGSDSYGLRKYVKKLMEEGYSHRNDSIKEQETKLTITSSSNQMTLNNNYYESANIKASTLNNITTYKITIENAPSGTVIVKDGKDNDYTKDFTIKGNETFKVKVPATNIKDTNLEMKVKATATGNPTYMAYEYQPVDSSMQNVALLEKNEKTVTSELSLKVLSSRVSITKIDSSTKKPLAGAKLVLKDTNSKIIASWVSTTNAHIIRNLANGNYTIEETQAPTGYTINKNITNFTISDAKKDIKVNIENKAKKVVVNIIKVDQATNSPLSGAVLVVKNSKDEVIARFTTEEKPYVLTDLADGVYTVEEISAPAGYVLNTNKQSFTIDDNHQSYQITFANAKATIVPDTASLSSSVMLLIGLSIIGTGILFIKKNAK